MGLARADLAQFDFALALLPGHPGAHSAATAAIYVEIGVATGRGCPSWYSPRLTVLRLLLSTGLTSVTVGLDNVDALRLHVSLFLRSLASEPRAAARRAQPVGDTLTAAIRARLEQLPATGPDPGNRSTSRTLRLTCYVGPAR